MRDRRRASRVDWTKPRRAPSSAMGSLLSALRGVARRRVLMYIALAVLLNPRWRRKIGRALGLLPSGRHLAPKSRDGAPGWFATLSHGCTHYLDSDRMASRRKPRSQSSCMIVLVHGFTTPSHCFTGMFDALAAEGHRVVTYDLWGRGWSDAPAAKQDASLFASQLADLLFTIGNADNLPVVVVGLSMGGGVVTEFALRFPDKVDGLVLLSPAGPQLKPVPVARLAQLPCIGDVAMHLFAKQVTSNYGDEFMHDDGRKYIEQFSQCHEFHLKNHPGLARSMLSSLRHMVYSQRSLAFKAVGSHPRPLAVSWGPLDNVTPIEDAPELLALMPNAKLTTHAGTGHWCLLEAPDEVKALVLDVTESAVKFHSSRGRQHGHHGHHHHHTHGHGHDAGESEANGAEESKTTIAT